MLGRRAQKKRETVVPDPDYKGPVVLPGVKLVGEVSRIVVAELPKLAFRHWT